MHKMVPTSRSRYDLRDSVSFNRVTLHLPLKKEKHVLWKKHLKCSCDSQDGITEAVHRTWSYIEEYLKNNNAMWFFNKMEEDSHYLMCVAGRDSSCRERNNSRCRSWCFCFSGKSTISGFSISSSISPSHEETKLIKNRESIDFEQVRTTCSKTFAK